MNFTALLPIAIDFIRNSPRVKQRHQTLLIMKLTAILLLFGLLQVSAKTFSQTNITLSVKDMPLEKVFAEIKKQSGYDFFYDNTIMDVAKKVTVKVKDATIEEAVRECLKDQPLDFKIIRQTISIKRKEAKDLGEIKELPGEKLDNIHGKVSDDKNKPAPGVTVSIKGSKIVTVTDENGEFTLKTVDRDAILVFSAVNMDPFEIKVDGKMNLEINLKTKIATLGSVIVTYSNGYQDIPKERATGSFVQIDNKLYNRTVSSDVISRLNGVANGVLFDQNSGNALGITVRGKSTINSSTQPLIVVDNFPYVGNILDLNPSDVESVTILKDAAASSIWGTSSGNGVIVITTKKGSLNQKPRINFDANVTIGQKPNLYYQPQLSPAQYIGVEQYLFNQGYYDGNISTGYLPVSPAVQIMLNTRNGMIIPSDSLSQINGLSAHDVRSEINKDFLQNRVEQQYNLNISGGGPNQTYYVSAGYDKNISNTVGVSNDRYTFTASNSYSLLNNKLRVNANVTFARAANSDYSIGPYNSGLADYPYEMLADSKGNALAVTNSIANLSSSYTDTAGQGFLLNWKYKPLDELRNRYNQTTSVFTDYKANIEATYSIIRPLSVSVNYQYFQSVNDFNKTYDENSFYVRNLVNEYSQIDYANNLVITPLAYGQILQRQHTNSGSIYARAKLSYTNTFNSIHNLTAFIGYEVRDDKANITNDGVYGYDPNSGTSVAVDNVSYFPSYYGYNYLQIPNLESQYGTEIKNISYYGNIGYTYADRFIITGSLRRDESNLFGVKENQKGVPLGSFGAGWNLNKESFYSINWLPQLKLSATYGFNGLVNNSVSALLTSTPYGQNTWQAYSTSILNPPNPSLRWEKVKNINLRVDFATKSNMISGSLEYYIKNGVDLIGASPIAPQAGITSFVGNTANTRGSGVDIQLNITTVQAKYFNWLTTLILNYNKNKVAVYMNQQGFNTDIIGNGIALSTRVGYPVNSVFAYRWGGLDASGNPQGYLNGKLSEDYSTLLYSNDSSSLIFKGSAVPIYYGSLRNTFSYKSLELSFNIIYKAGYYFRRSSVNYTSLFNGVYTQADFLRRWQHPGDEASTYVPSMMYPSDPSRDLFYSQSSVLLEKGDNIRLQDIRLSLLLDKKMISALPFSNVSLYLYATNIGILWRANSQHIDPDASISGYPATRTIAIGTKLDF